LEERRHNGIGALALVGSGEYTAQMEATDRFLMEAIGGAARVAVIPTASGLEPGMPQRWNERGVKHFQSLGATVTPIPLVTTDDAHNPEIVAVLRAANFFYFSGGNPEYITETLQGTPAWSAITDAAHDGGVLAGCSAGAMMLGSYTLRVRAVVNGQPPQWASALGMAPGLAVMPHFDRISGFVGPDIFRAILDSAPAGVTLIGIDEDTALVALPGDASSWRVMGRQTVSVIGANGERRVYWAGEIVIR
jgi:cyanophycinase-like exopeptidase